jgi:UDP-3-O-[3-hydroxymyristoyl] glucosamine N-acyltransferase
MGGRPGRTLGEIAVALGATLEGDATYVVSGVAPLETAGPEHIAFVTDAGHRATALTSRAGAFLVPPGVTGLPRTTLRCPAPRLALVDLLGLFYPPAPPTPGVHASAVVAPDARIAPSACIGALVVVESGAVIAEGVHLHPLVYVGLGVEIGEGSVVYPHVVVRDGVRIGRRVIVHSGAILGADGFGYAHDGTHYRKIPQVGGVVVEDDVEIGANTTVDRATLGQTVVRRGVKIDNLVQVGHNAEIGEDTVIVAQTGLAGSCRVGRGVVLGAQVGVGNKVSIGDGAMLGGQTGVISDVGAGEKLFGTYGRPLTQFQRIWVAEAQLPDLIRRVRGLERRLEQIERQKDGGRAARADGDA